MILIFIYLLSNIQIYSSLSFIVEMQNLYFALYYFCLNIYVEILYEFCLVRNSTVFATSFNMLFRSFAVVITPMVSRKEPNMIKVVPNLLYKSKETPPILHSWKNELVCFYESPK